MQANGRASVIEYYVYLFSGVVTNDLVHEIEKLNSPPAIVVTRAHHSGCYVNCGEQGSCALPFVFVTEPGDCAAIGQLKVALGALKRLNVRFLVHRDHNGIIRRSHIESHNIGGLADKLRIGADTPTVLPPQGNPSLAQRTPAVILRRIARRRGKQAASLGSITRWRFLVELVEDTLHRPLIIHRRSSASQRLLQSGDSVCRELGATGAYCSDANTR